MKEKDQVKKVIIICSGFDEERLTEGTKTPCAKCGKSLWLSTSSIKKSIARVRELGLDPTKVIEANCVACGTNSLDMTDSKQFPQLSTLSEEERIAFLKALMKKAKQRENKNNDNDKFKEL